MHLIDTSTHILLIWTSIVTYWVRDIILMASLPVDRISNLIDSVSLGWKPSRLNIDSSAFKLYRMVGYKDIYHHRRMLT